MDQRMRFLVACRDTDEAFAAICREFGVSRKTGYKWLERYDTLGVAGLVDQPRVAEVHPRWLTDAAVDAIIEARKDHPHWGPKKLQVWMCKSRPELARVGVSTIAGVLKRFGLVRARRRRPSVPRYSEPLDEQLRAMVQAGKGRFRRLKRAQILLAASAGSSDVAIAKNVVVGASTVYRTKRRFVEEGLEAALSEEPRPGADRKLAAKEEALLVATACSAPPVGRARWTLELLPDAMVRLTKHESLSSETIRRRLAENQLKPWQKMWCIPKVDAEFVARMEDVLELYAEAPDEQHPVVCFDETPRQLIGESRVPVAPKPGRPARFDYEYVRNGTANVFMFVDVHRPWRHAKVTDRRTCRDFAECMRDLVDVHYPHAERIRVVMDNLSTHSAAALYESFDAAEARRILRRLEFHFTPKHASWLNMVEIEIGVMVSQCLDRRIPTKEILVKEVKAWERRRNRDKSRIKWLFTVERAREKLGRAYPALAGQTANRAAA